MSAPTARSRPTRSSYPRSMWCTPRDRRRALRRQAGHDHRRPGTDVVRPHLGAREARHAAHDGVVAVGADLGAEPLQLLDVAETPRVEVLGDDADTVGDRQHRDDQRLVVGGDAGVRQRRHVDRPHPVAGPHAQPVRQRLELEAHVAEPRQHHLHVPRLGVEQRQLSPGDGAGGDVGGGLDAVGDRLVVAGVELILARRPRSAGATCRCPRSGRPS